MAAHATEDAGAADDDCGDRSQLMSVAQAVVAGADVAREHQSGQGCHAAGDHIQSAHHGGLRVDERGSLWIATTHGVDIVGADGDDLMHLDVPEPCANVEFGGPEGRTLFIAASTSIYAIDTLVRKAARPAHE